jgi:predicted permease
MLAIFLETLNITAPVFAMLFLGVLLKRIDWINDNFIHTASALVFNVTMPALLFLGILHADLHAALQPALLIYFSLATLVCFAIAWGWAIFKCPREDRGIYTQGAFRGNNGVIGLALAASMYGDYGISLGAILAALVILFYNTLSTIVLAVYSPVIKSDPWSICKSVMVNPLIISVFAAAPFAYFKIRLAGMAGDVRPISGANHLAIGVDLHWRHAVAGGDAQKRLDGIQFEPGENARSADSGDARRVALGLSWRGIGDSVSVLRQPDRRRQFRHGPSGRWQS